MIGWEDRICLSAAASEVAGSLWCSPWKYSTMTSQPICCVIGASLAVNGEKEDLWVIAGGRILTQVHIAVGDLYGNEHDSILPLILLSEIDPLDNETCIIEHLFICLGRCSFSFPHPASLIHFYLPFILFGSELILWVLRQLHTPCCIECPLAMLISIETKLHIQC